VTTAVEDLALGPESWLEYQCMYCFVCLDKKSRALASPQGLLVTTKGPRARYQRYQRGLQALKREVLLKRDEPRIFANNNLSSARQ
jgi:hypothetical protein